MGLLITALYNIVDQIFIGNSELGYLGNAATGVSFPIICIANAFAWCIGDGAAAFLSICAGRGDKDSAHKCVGTCITLTTITSIVLTAVCLVWSRPFMAMFGASDQTLDMAVEYFRIVVSFFPFYLLLNVTNSMIRADGSPSFAMIAMLTGAVINIALDPLFIFVFKWGIAGAAWATVIGQVLAGLMVIYYFIKKAREYVKIASEEAGRPLTFCVTTFGCQMNARDSEKLVGILEEIGYVEEVDEEKADFVIYNTCTVRENANMRVYGRLGQLKASKKKNPHMMIGLCGCMMQEPHVVEKLKTSYRFVDIIFGTHNIYKFAELIATRYESQRMVIDIWKDTDKIVEDLPSERKFPFKSGVNIMFGCNNFCSYCIVPYVRGRERSRNPKDIIREIEHLVSDGVVEVMLLGQNVNSYGKNLEEPMSFAQLLQEIEKIEGLERIRFMTSHPKDLSDELIK